jgi:hypothetical protein
MLHNSIDDSMAFGAMLIESLEIRNPVPDTVNDKDSLVAASSTQGWITQTLVFRRPNETLVAPPQWSHTMLSS